jgi:hypothetical protein
MEQDDHQQADEHQHGGEQRQEHRIHERKLVTSRSCHVVVRAEPRGEPTPSAPGDRRRGLDDQGNGVQGVDLVRDSGPRLGPKRSGDGHPPTVGHEDGGDLPRSRSQDLIRDDDPRDRAQA